MIRILNHYLHRQTLLDVLADLLLLAAVVLGALLAMGHAAGSMWPLAGAQVVSLAAGVFVINSASGLYQVNPHYTAQQAVARAGLALLLALPLTYLVTALLPAAMEGRELVRLAAMAGVGAVIVRRVYRTTWALGRQAGARILILGCGPAAAQVTQALRESDPQARVIGYYPSPNEADCQVDAGKVLSTARRLSETAQQLGIDEIVVALTERRAGSMPLRDLLDCKLLGIRVCDVNTHFEKTKGQIRLGFANAGWMIFGDGFDQGVFRTVVKRLFDMVCGAALLVLAAPLMLLAALAVKLDSRGPVFYRQERVGLNGTTFMVTKFRSMCADAEKDGQPRWAAADDDRVTRIGALMRKTRIDELPQLFNVLRGEMSLVGPRPERPYFVEKLTEQIPYFSVRQSLKPGVTGWAQVRYAYGATVEDSIEKLQYDLYYVKNHSLFLDIVILFETVAVVLTGKGAR